MDNFNKAGVLLKGKFTNNTYVIEKNDIYSDKYSLYEIAYGAKSFEVTRVFQFMKEVHEYINQKEEEHRNTKEWLSRQYAMGFLTETEYEERLKVAT